MLEFENFRKSKVIKDMIIEINHLEENGDRLYTEAMHRLYTKTSDTLEVLSWTTIITVWRNAVINVKMRRMSWRLLS